MDLLPTPCIQSNPDIAGIGVLYAVCAQAALSFVASGLAMTDGIITAEERERNSVLPKGNLFLSISITSIALIQHTKLSVYHSLIVLNFGWILEGPLLLTSSSTLVRAAAARYTTVDNKKAFDAVQQGTETSWWMFVSRFLQATFGILVWSNITTYGGELAKCTDRTYLFILGGIWTVPVLNNIIKIFSILVYGIRLLEVVATIPNANVMWDLRGGRKNSDIQIYIPIAVGRFLLALLLVGVLMVNTTIMIESSKKSILVSQGESDWGFGQMLSALSTANLGIEAFKDLRKWCNGQRWWKRTTEQDKVHAQKGMDMADKQGTTSDKYRAHVSQNFISKMERKLSIKIQLPNWLLPRTKDKKLKDDEEMRKIDSDFRVDRTTGVERANENTTTRQRLVSGSPEFP